VSTLADPASAELASWGRRLCALVVDGMLLATVVVSTMAAAGIPLDEISSTVRNGSGAALIALFVLPEAVYDTAMIGSRSQTIGKMALRIRVVGADDRRPIGYMRAFTRWLATALLWVFTIPGLVDHLWPLHDRRNQALHDKFARSVVVRS